MINANEREALQQAIMQGDAYSLAFEDTGFLAGEDLRPIRLQLELLKPERGLRAHDVHAAIVVFGSARIKSPEDAQVDLARIQVRLETHPDEPGLAGELVQAKRRLAQSRWYNEARRFTDMASRRFQREGRCDLVVMTGGGPGIMEAANRGAFEAGERSVGLNITLPHEQRPNPFITPELAFRFHYFALRKMHLVLRAKALVVFPGGYGTIDELFEVLTLVQTHKMPPIPIVLFGEAFWRRAVDFEFLVQEGMIAAADLDLFTMVDSAEEAVATLHDFFEEYPIQPVQNQVI